MHIISHNRILVRNPEGRRLFGRHTCRLENNNEMDILCVRQWTDSVGWIQLAQSVVQWEAMNTVMNIQMTSKACSLLTS